MDRAIAENLKKIDSKDIVDRETARAFFANLDRAEAIQLAGQVEPAHRRAINYLTTPIASLPLFAAALVAAYLLVPTDAAKLAVCVIGAAIGGGIGIAWAYGWAATVPMERRITEAALELPDDVAVEALPYLLLDPQDYASRRFKPREPVLRRLTGLLRGPDSPRISEDAQLEIARYIKGVVSAAYRYPILEDALPELIVYLARRPYSQEVKRELEQARTIAGFRKKNDRLLDMLQQATGRSLPQ